MTHPHNPYGQPPGPPQQPGAAHPQAPQAYGHAHPPQAHGYPPAQGYGHPPYHPPSPPPPEYEFTAAENQTIANTAQWGRILAILMFVMAAPTIFAANVYGVFVYVGLGISFWGGGTALRKVVDTQGRDVTNMLDALDKLSTAFLIRIILMGIVGVIGGIVAIAVIVAAVAG